MHITDKEDLYNQMRISTELRILIWHWIILQYSGLRIWICRFSEMLAAEVQHGWWGDQCEYSNSRCRKSSTSIFLYYSTVDVPIKCFVSSRHFRQTGTIMFLETFPILLHLSNRLRNFLLARAICNLGSTCTVLWWCLYQIVTSTPSTLIRWTHYRAIYIGTLNVSLIGGWCVGQWA